MKSFAFKDVSINSGYLHDIQELNRKTTINAVYEKFFDSGRIGAFNFDYDPDAEGSVKPHVFWDSDVAKWIEGASYILMKHSAPELEAKIDALVANIKKNQSEDGYFNIFFTVVEPENRFKKRNAHELYCAGHLMEAAVAYDAATGKQDFLECMERYADCIYRVFVEEGSAAFATPGHEEIELALVKMYDYTGKKKYLDLALHFLNARGVAKEHDACEYNQSHLPVREQSLAVGHSVRAVYLYCGMALAAKRTGDEALADACRKLWEDTVSRKMYVTGGLGSSDIGEAFTSAYDLPNDIAYTETCAGIGLMLFSQAMLAIENDAKYADVIERVLYNGVLSGLSLDGKAFFYENPLEINLSEHFDNGTFGKRRFPITQRVECFDCSCCPPNLNRLIPMIESYIYGMDGDTLYVNQFISSTLKDGGVSCVTETTYPNGNTVRISAGGIKRVAVRIPEWCDSFKINRDYKLEGGYAIVDGCGDIVVEFDMTPVAVFADPRVIRDAGRLCVMRGPIVYCAESVDNSENLHSYVLSPDLMAKEELDESFGLYTLRVPCRTRVEFSRGLYSHKPAETRPAEIKLIPYRCFANRGQSNMLVWFCADRA